MCATTNNAPCISVIIPTHNRCEMLDKALQSVLDQTFENLEVIVIDDASSDTTLETVKHFDDDRIRYVRHDENKGGSASRNTGIENARGEYVAFLDDDDVWLPAKLELQMSKFHERLDVDVVSSGFFVRDAEKDRIIGSASAKIPRDTYNALLRRNMIGTPSTVIIRREALGDSCRFDPELPSRQDWDMWLQLAKNSTFDSIEEPLVVYNLHGNRMSTDYDSSLAGRMRILEKYRNDIECNRAALSNHYLRIGSAYCQLGRMTEGREKIKKSLALRPCSFEGLIALSSSFLGRAFYDRCIKSYLRLRYYVGEKKRNIQQDRRVT